MARGIEHIGITVPDVDSATAYFTEAFGARLLYDTLPAGSRPYGGEQIEARLGVGVGTAISRVRMLQLSDGPSIELFEYQTRAERRPPVTPADFGLQHFALYTDDMAATCQRVLAAGGEVLVGPTDFELEPEAGPGNQWCYTRAPWGTTIELTTFPSPQGYEAGTDARRWRPGLPR